MASQPGTPNLLAGIAYFSIDGTPYDVAGSAKYSVSTVERETKAGPSGVQGFGEKPVPGWIEIEIRDSGVLSVAQLNAVTNSTLLLQLANGKNIMGGPMWQVGEIAVDATEGMLTAKFEGPSVTEI